MSKGTKSLTRAERRVLSAHRRAAYTSLAVVVLFDDSGKQIGTALRSTCEKLCIKGLLDEDQSRLSDDGHGDFDYVLTGKVEA